MRKREIEVDLHCVLLNQTRQRLNRSASVQRVILHLRIALCGTRWIGIMVQNHIRFALYRPVVRYLQIAKLHPRNQKICSILIACEYTRNIISNAAATENRDPIMEVSVNSPLRSALILRHPSEIEATDIFPWRDKAGQLRSDSDWSVVGCRGRAAGGVATVGHGGLHQQHY